jgi:hypothetical protein
MQENKNSLLQHYYLMRRDLLDSVRGIDEQAIAKPSLDGWSVKDHPHI